jgi:hypothetical protein
MTVVDSSITKINTSKYHIFHYYYNVKVCMIMINTTKIGLLFLGIILSTAATIITTYPIQAETGKGKDVFKVILTMFGADRSKGDVVAIVTVNGGEASKVKFLDTEALSASSSPTASAPSTINPAAESDIIEYVATFPNVTVNPGQQYQVCVLPVKSLDLICTTGSNSPAHRPEFVDLNLNNTRETEQAIRQQGDEDESDEG